MDCVLVDVGTEEGGGAAWVDGSGGKEGGRNACFRFNTFGGVTEGVGDEFRFGVVPFAVVRVSVVVAMDRGVRVGSVALEVACDAAQRFGWAEEGVMVGSVAYELASNSILLVSEFECRRVDGGNTLHVIQRSCWARVECSVDGEGDVAEPEGLGSSFWCGGVGVLRGSEEPVPGNDDEIDGGGVSLPPDGVICVKGCEQ